MGFLKRLYKDLENYLFTQTKINDIFQVFVDCYGEDRVDIQLNTSLEQFISSLSTMYHNSFDDAGYFTLLRDCDKNLIKELILKYKGSKNTYINKFINANFVYVYILVYFPKVTVTNEHGESIDIEEVYIRVPINCKNKMESSFEIIRTKYSYDQYMSGYMHSHAYSGISKTSRDWRSMCLGSGPLVTTTHTLKSSYDLDIWRLFCIELDEYLKVESVAGVPYIRMNRVGNNSDLFTYKISTVSSDCNDAQYRINRYNDFFKDFLKLFIYKLCKNVNYFTFRNNDICLSMSNEQFAIVISKYFIEYCNNKQEIDVDILITDWLVLARRDVAGTLNYFRQRNPSSRGEDMLSDTKVLTFKGQDKYVKVDARVDNTQNKEIYLLRPDIVSQVLNYLLKLINYGNTKEFTTNSKIPYFF